MKTIKEIKNFCKLNENSGSEVFQYYYYFLNERCSNCDFCKLKYVVAQDLKKTIAVNNNYLKNEVRDLKLLLDFILS